MKILILLVIAGLYAPFASAVVITLEPAGQIVRPGESVSVDVVVDDLNDGGAPSVGFFDLDIGFDPGELAFGGFTLGGGLGDLDLFEAQDFSLGLFAPGFVNIAALSFLETDEVSCIFCLPPFLDDLQDASLVLATLDFLVLDLGQNGSTPIYLFSVNALGDGAGSPLVLDDIVNATLQSPPAATVPEPPTIGMLALGLLWLATSRLRTKSARQYPAASA